MQRILRTLTSLMALVAVTGLVACGGDDAKVSESTDVDTLLKETFTGKKDIKSGKFDLAVRLDVKGGNSPVQGPISVKLAGPFESQGQAKLPKFDLDLAFEGAGQSVKAGATSTGEKGFINFNGTDYAVSNEIFAQFKKSYEQAAKQGSGQNQSLQSLGIDPQKWLTNAKNAGEAKVGDTDTVKITGDVDVGKLLDDVNSALSKAGSLGLQGQVPTKLTEEQKAEIQKAVKDLSVNIYTGKEDTILRRMEISFGIDSGSQGSATVALDLKLLDLNEGQEFTEPKNPKPFEELAEGLGGLGLGGLGGLGGSGGGGSSGGSGGGSSGSSGSSSANLEEYTKCIEDAGNDLQKAQKCAELLTP